MDSDSDFSDDDNINFVKMQEKMKSRQEYVSDSESDDEQPSSKSQRINFGNQYEQMKFNNLKNPNTYNTYASQNKMFNTNQPQYGFNQVEYSDFDPNQATYGVSNDMTHNNMMPQFKSKTYGYDKNFEKKQTEHSIRQIQLMTGSDQNLQFKHKTEVPYLFDPIMNKIDSVTGTPNFSDFRQSRAVPSQYRQGEKPFQPVLVAKGVNLGYNSNGHGGITGGDNYRALPRNVDELRTVNNPKISYTLPVIPGQKGTSRSIIGDVSKNKQETFYINSDSTMIPTSAIETAPALYGQVQLKEQSRTETGNNTHLNPAQGKMMNYLINPNNLISKETNRETMGTITNATGNYGAVSLNNYLNLIPDNTKRGILNKYNGNMTGALQGYLFNSINSIPDETLKSLLSEKVRISNQTGPTQNINLNYTPTQNTLKELTENNIYLSGMSGPEQSYLFNHLNNIPDPTLRNLINAFAQNNGNLTGNYQQGKLNNYEDIAETNLRELVENNKRINNIQGGYNQTQLNNYTPTDITLKELTENNTNTTGFKGFQEQNKLNNYTPTQTTLKELTENNNYVSGFKGFKEENKLNNYTPTQTTLKELTENNKHMTGFKGFQEENKLNNYTPTQTTLKELTENNKHMTGFKGFQEQNKLNNYTPLDTTIKELTETNNAILNIVGNYKQGKIFNTEPTKNTLRELTEKSQHLLNITGNQLHSKMSNYDSVGKTTLRELIESSTQIHNVASTILKQGKLINFKDIPDITKRNMVENNTNIIGMKGNEQSRSRLDANNAVLNVQKEISLKGREPTTCNVSKGYTTNLTKFNFKNDNTFFNDNESNLTRGSANRSNLGIKNELFNF